MTTHTSRHSTPLFALALVLLAALACSVIPSGILPMPATPTTWPTPRPTSTPAPTATATPLPIPPSDGWIAFENQGNLWLVHPDGSGLRQITKYPVSTKTNLFKAKWSPDGGSLAFTQTKNGQLAVFELPSSAVTTLDVKTNGGFDWWSNGKQIIYDQPIKSGSGNFDYHTAGFGVLNLADRKHKQLIKTTTDVPAIIKPDGSPDGSYVLYAALAGFEPGGYGVGDIQTGKLLPLLSSSPSPSSCEWLGAQPIIVCDTSTERGAPQITFLGVDGTVQRNLLLPETMDYLGSTAWSPQGDRLAVGYVKAGQPVIDLLAPDTGQAQTLAASGYLAGWSPDERWLLVWASDAASQQSFSIVDVNSGASFPVTQGSNPVWQP